MAFVPLHVRTARSMARGVVACTLVAVWALVQIAETAETGDYEEILLSAVFSAAAMCGALSVVTLGRTPAPTTAQAVATTALGLPYLLGLYLGLYRGVWGAAEMFDRPSLLVLGRTVALVTIGFVLVEASGSLTGCVRRLVSAPDAAGRPQRHRRGHARGSDQPVHPFG